MNKDESGITLVEVLAVLVLASLVTTLIWTTILITIKYNHSETSKLKMQQEANYLLTAIQEVHRKNNCYEIYVPSATEVILKDCSSSKVLLAFQSQEAVYLIGGNATISNNESKMPIYTNRLPKGINSDFFKPKYLFELELTSLTNERLKLSVTSTISRYSKDGIK